MASAGTEAAGRLTGSSSRGSGTAPRPTDDVTVPVRDRPAKFSGHDRQQWERQRGLPNLIYTNGVVWRLYGRASSVLENRPPGPASGLGCRPEAIREPAHQADSTADPSGACRQDAQSA